VQPTLRRRFAVAGGPWPERPVAIALVITDLDIGGAERSLAALATRLNPARWRVGVFCLREPGPLAEALRQAGVFCECLGVRRRNPIQAVTRLARSLRRFRPDLVQSFMFHANLAARLGAPWAGFPWVVAGLRVAEHEKRWHLLLDRLTASLVTGSVCVSQGVLRFSRDVAGLDPDRLIVIPNGIDTNRFASVAGLSRAEIKVPETAHLALFVGRLDIQKGLPSLLDAAQKLVDERPTWQLALAGDGPRRTWLVGQINSQRGFQGRVRWLGSRDDIPALLKAADVLVLPSLWEGMPNVVLEAMAAARPVIGTAVEGIEDLVVPGQTGWLVPPGDVASLAQALLEAVDSPQRCRELGENGRHRVEQEFSLPRMVAAYESVWARVLGFEVPSPDVAMPKF
jgi:glycosyltransferase involved in cell wall biosynthesis